MSPGGGRRIFSETTTAPGVRKGIGSALALLPLLVCCGLVSPAPALTRRTRWAAGILVASLASLALLPPEPAGAQTTIDLVSNTGQTGSLNTRSISGQSFTTGSNSAGYTVTQVQVVFQDNSINDPKETTVKIRNNSASNLPGTLVATLTQSGNAALRGTITFTAPANTTLSASTTYWLTVNEDKTSTAERAFISAASSDSETGATGWSIANTRRWHSPSGGTPDWSASSTSSSSARIAIRGYANATVTLSSSAITPTTATLTLANNSSTWYYKKTAPTPAGTCSSSQAGTVTALNLTGLSASTSYTYKAYSDSGCTTANEIASESFRTATPAVDNTPQTPATGVVVSGTTVVAIAFRTGERDAHLNSVTLAIANSGSGQLEVSIHEARRSGRRGSASAWPLARIGSNLTGTIGASGGNTTYTASGITLKKYGMYYLRVAAKTGATRTVGTTSSNASTSGHGWSIANVARKSTNGGTSWSRMDSKLRFSLSGTAAPTLYAKEVKQTSGQLRLENRTGTSWWYKRTAPTAGTCTRVLLSGNTSLTGLSASTTYTYKAYSASGCAAAAEVASESFRTPASNVATLTATTIGQTSASLQIAGYTGQWWHKRTYPTVSGTCTAVSSESQGGNLQGLTAGTEYSWAAYDSLADCTNTDLHPREMVAMEIFRTDDAAGGGGAVGAAVELADPTVPPGPVTNIAVTHNGTSLTVTWEAPAEGATHYDVTYSGGGVNARAAWHREGTSLEITCDSRAEYKDQNCVAAGTAYIVGVRARNAAGVSAWRNSAPASVPDPVAKIRVTHQGTSLAVSWDAPSGATHYDVTYYRHDTKVNARAAWNRAGTSLNITCDSRAEYKDQHCVDAGSSYTVGVRSRNGAGASPWANSAPAAAPSLAVADATVAEPSEGLSSSLDFVVTLSPASPAAVTVDYGTGGGTATAGSDYTSTSGRLSFAAGETTKTISVPVLADSHDDSGETLTLTLSNATGAKISDAEATGTITNDGHIPKGWNARFGRTVADQVLEGVETRLRSEPTPGMEVYLAGERLEWPAASDGTQPVSQQVGDQLAQWLVVGSGDNGDAAVRTLNGDDLLASSSFALASPVSGDGLLSFWGRGAVTNFDGRDGELSWTAR